ncbi:anacyclamide/piricyclamide family prenylated cyclic peptide, partial [Dolichospermum circinale]
MTKKNIRPQQVAPVE